MGKRKEKNTPVSFHWRRKYFHSPSSFQLQIVFWLGMVSFVPASPFPWWYFIELLLYRSCACSACHCGFICVLGFLLLILCMLFMEMIFPWSNPSPSTLRKLYAFLFAQISESWGKGFDQTFHPNSLTLRTLSISGSLKISSFTARISFSDKGWVMHLSIALWHLKSVNCYVCFQTFYIDSHMKTTFHTLCFKRLRIMTSLSHVYSITAGSWRQCVEKTSIASLWNRQLPYESVGQDFLQTKANCRHS